MKTILIVLMSFLAIAVVYMGIKIIMKISHRIRKLENEINKHKSFNI